MRPDFSLIWGADNAPFTPIEASDYTAGWVFRTGAPPRRVNFDYFQNLSDQRTAWLGEQMLLAVGHEWQNDVTYNAYAIVRSPVNGQLYRSLVGGNLNNEPSVSGSQWALGVANIQDASETAKGIVELATSAETIAGLSTALATHPAGIFAALTAFLPKRVFAANDFIRIPDVPGGLIIQFGYAPTIGPTQTTITLPTAFPTSFRAVVPGNYGLAGTSSEATSVNIISLSQFGISSVSPGDAAWWIAVGN